MNPRPINPFNPLGESRPNAEKTGDLSDPFQSMRREMDRLVDTFARGWAAPSLGATASGYLSPRMNVSETSAGLELTAELPGVEEGDIDVSLAEGVLTLKAEHKAEREEKDEARRYHVVERSYGTFLRRFALPFEPDADKVEASFEKGVLKVVVPRLHPSESQIRKIAIKSN